MTIMTEAKAGRIDFAMRLIGASDVYVTNPQPVGQDAPLYRGMIALTSFERVGKAFTEQFERLAAGIAGHGTTPVMIELPHIIYAMAMVGVIMGPEDGIDVNDIGGEQLRAHVG